MWWEAWGGEYKKLKILAEQGVGPLANNEQPQVEVQYQLYYKCYCDLQHDRPVGMSLGNVPWSSIIKWCELHGIYDINEIDIFVRLIRAIERAVSDYHKSVKGKNKGK